MCIIFYLLSLYLSFSQPQEYNNTVITSGHVVNTNTVEEFRDLDKTALIKSEGRAFIELLSSPEGLRQISQNPNLLTHFFILTYGNLKNYNYKYWFAFPAISSIKIFRVGTKSGSTTTTTSEEDNNIQKQAITIEISQEQLQNAVQSNQEISK